MSFESVDFFLVRHAPVIKPDGVTAGWLYGWTDLAADTSDDARIEAVADRLPQEAQVVTSDLVRTIETSRALGYEPDLEEQTLREQHFGDWENTALSDIPATHEIWHNPHAYKPPGGEAWVDVRARVRDWFDTFEPEHDKVIIVGHSGSLRALIAEMLDLPDATALRLSLDTLSLSCARHFPASQSWAVKTLNWTP